MLFYSMSVAFWDRVLRIPIFIPDLQIPEGSLGSAPLPQGWGGAGFGVPSQEFFRCSQIPFHPNSDLWSFEKSWEC